MIVVVIVVILVAIGAAVFFTTSKKKGEEPARPAASPAVDRATPARPAAEAPARPASSVPPSARDRARAGSSAPTRTEPAATPTVEPQVGEPADDDEPDLSRFGGTPAPKAPAVATDPAPSSSVSFRYPMEASITDLVADTEPAGDEPAGGPATPLETFADAVAAPSVDEAPEPAPAEVVSLVAEPAVVAEPDVEPADDAPSPSFDLDRVLVAPLFGSWNDEADADADDDEVELEGTGATVTRLEPRVEPVEEAPLAEIVADLIDAADPEVAEVMARLIDSSDPDLVARLVDADDLEVAEVVAKLLDAADDEVRSMVVDLADAPDRRQVAEVLKLVDAAYAGDDAVGVLSPDIAEKLEELDIESDLELTSRPAEMAQFARLENKDQLRVIIRVLCGLVAREDLPRSPRMPAVPASSAENRRWPLSRARWPVPPPDDEDIVKRAPLPARRADTKAS